MLICVSISTIKSLWYASMASIVLHTNMRVEDDKGLVIPSLETISPKSAFTSRLNLATSLAPPLLWRCGEELWLQLERTRTRWILSSQSEVQEIKAGSFGVRLKSDQFMRTRLHQTSSKSFSSVDFRIRNSMTWENGKAARNRSRLESNFDQRRLPPPLLPLQASN